MSRQKRVQRKHVPTLRVLSYSLLWQLEPTPSAGVLDRLVADGFPPKVALAKVYQLVGLGLLDYGCSPRFAWLTAEGKTMLATEVGSA